MPVLQYLWIDGNCLTTLRTISHWNFPFLRQLSLSKIQITAIGNNMINSCEEFYQLGTKNLQVIVLEFWKQDRLICESVNWIAKLNACKLAQLRMFFLINIQKLSHIKEFHRILLSRNYMTSFRTRNVKYSVAATTDYFYQSLYSYLLRIINIKLDAFGK